MILLALAVCHLPHDTCTFHFNSEFKSDTLTTLGIKNRLALAPRTPYTLTACTALLTYLSLLLVYDFLSHPTLDDLCMPPGATHWLKQALTGYSWGSL